MTDKVFDFKYVQSTHKQARTGVLTTPHGVIQTPAFIFCATKGAMKCISAEDMHAAGTQIILSNTYHMLLQPGPELVKKFGGLQKFTGWRGPMLTDSGGFQIFSMGQGTVANEIKGKRLTPKKKTLLKITEDGAIFRSYINGQKYVLTPEFSIQIQRQLGADLIVVLDECPPFHVEKRYTEKSMEMSHRWAIRSLKEFEKDDDHTQSLYGIVQGGVYADLRKRSADFVSEQNFFGHAVGGCLGAHKDQMYEVIGMSMEHLKRQRPVHLLGIGSIVDIFSGVEQGIDTFDCVHPTRLARHGGALVRPLHNSNPKREHINLWNSQYKLDDSPLEPDCSCNTCKNYTKGYIHHLLKAQELLAYSLLTFHNVAFMNRLMASIRHSLESNTFEENKKMWC